MNTVPYIAEICMAMPDVICIIARDQDLNRLGIVELAAQDTSAALHSVVLRNWPYPAGPGQKYCDLVGMKNGVDRMYLNFRTEQPTNFIDRAAIDDHTKWSVTGSGLTVTAVYRKSRPYAQYDCYNGSGTNLRGSQFEHYIYLKLSGNMPQNTACTISVTGDTIPATAFTFNDRTTRCVGLHTSQSGYRAAEQGKVAQLSLWIPKYGTRGVVDYPTYGLSAPELIDQNDVTVFTGTLSTYIDSTTQETHTYFGGPFSTSAADLSNFDYADTTQGPFNPSAVTSISAGAATQFTLTSHGLTTGNKVYLEGFGKGSGAVLFGTSSMVAPQTVTVIDANNFSVPLSMNGTWVSGTYLAGFDSNIYKMWNGNRWATNVYRVDFSAFDAVTYPGSYRVRIPGLGVSDAFLLDESARLKDAAIHLKGYYNQLTGIALDPAIGGWSRPVAHADGQNGVAIYESLCPAWFTSEGGINLGSTITNTGAAFATATEAVGWGLTVRDAGDWDYHLLVGKEGDIAYCLCEYGYRCLPSAVRNFQFGFPKASTIDGTLYAGTDSLGDAFHMAIHQLDCFRKYQKVDGRVYGGLTFYRAGNPTNSGGYSLNEPSYMSAATFQPFVLAADPNANMMYAASAAKVAQVLLENGFTTAGNTWMDSAKLAFAWAENIYQDYLTNGVTGSIIDGYFTGVCNFQTNAAANGYTYWTTGTNYADAFAGLLLGSSSTFQSARNVAAATIYNATNANTFTLSTTTYDLGAIAVTKYNSGLSGMDGRCCWEFVQSTDAQTRYSTQVPYINGRWPNAMSSIVGMTGLGNGWEEFIHAALKSSPLDHTNQYLKWLQYGRNYANGTNQEDMSRTVGIGTRYPRQPSIRDREAMQLGVGSTPGTSVFMHVAGLYASWYYFNYGTDDGQSYNAIIPLTDTKIVNTPSPNLLPFEESYTDNTNCIYSSEFQVVNPIVPFFVSDLILHAFDGNTAKVSAPPKLKRSLTVS